MNKQLKYSKGAVKGFTGNVSEQSFAVNTVAQQNAENSRNYVFTRANQCRGNRSPIFVNEGQFLPLTNSNSVTSILVTQPSTIPPVPKDNTAIGIKLEEVVGDDVSALTMPPQVKKEPSLLVKGLIVGVVAAVVFKILS